MENELLKLLFGEGSTSQIIATYIFAFIGAIYSLSLNVKSRDKLSPESPYHFSWNFLWCDNTKRIITSVISIFICLRFAKEIFGVDVTMYFALIIGFSLDKLSQYIKDRVKFKDEKGKD